MLDVSIASNQSKRISDQSENLNNARNELLAYKRIIEAEYHAGEVPALITKINNVISQIDDAKNMIRQLSDSVNNTAVQIRREEEAEAARQEAAKREAAKREAAKREAAKREAAKREAAKREAAKREAAKREAAKREAARRNTYNHEYASNDEKIAKANSEYKLAKEKYESISKEIKKLEAQKTNFLNFFRIPAINSEIERLKKELKNTKTILDEKSAIINSFR